MARPLLLRADMLRHALAALVVLSTLEGCHAARMQPDAKLAQKAQPMPFDVQGSLFSDDAIVFGPFRATNIQRSWKTTDSSSGGLGSGHVVDSKSNQTWSFDVARENGPVVHVACTWHNSATQVNFTSTSSMTQNVQSVICHTSEGNDSGELSLGANGGRWSGTLKHGDLQLSVTSRHELEGGSSLHTPAGYELAKPDGVVAAVQTVNGSVAWIDAGLPPRAQTIAAAALVSMHYLEKAREH